MTKNTGHRDDVVREFDNGHCKSNSHNNHNTNNSMNASMNDNNVSSHNNTAIPLDVIDDLCSRFIINIPPEERSDLVRVCFHIELAYWFYIDYNCEERKELPKVQYKAFARTVFANVPFLQQHVSKVDSVIEKWRDYKMAVPTYGAILLDEKMDNVLLVQGFWAKSSWGFPKGKVNADEDPVKCACREVLEETGFDCSSTISAKDFIELHIQDTLIRLYIVTGVDTDTIFKPMTRCEIKSCNWFKISDLPVTRRDLVTIQNKQLKANAFFMAIPFIKPLRKWIYTKRKSLLNDNESLSAIKAYAPDDVNETIHLERYVAASNNPKSTSKTPRSATKNTPRLPKICKEQSSVDAERRFWSPTWASVKIDWNDLIREITC